MHRKIWLLIIVLLGATLACNAPTSEPGDGGPPIIFERPPVLFPSNTPNPTQIQATLAPSLTPTRTPRVWPSPYFGTPGPTPVTPVPTPMLIQTADDSITFLLIGTDTSTNKAFRTDTLIIVNIQPEHEIVTMISIPRDLFVYIPGWTMSRINTAWGHGQSIGYPGGGAGLLKDTILYNLGVEIDHIALVDFDGFRQIVNTLGGIDIPLVCSYQDWHIIDPNKDAQDEDNWELYTVGPGVVHMDGDLALWYARSRLRSSDFDRGRRQQEVLRAIFERGLSLNIIPQVPQLFTEMQDAVITDIGPGDLPTFIPLVSDLRSSQIRSYFISTNMATSWRTPQGGSVQLPNGTAIQAMLAEALSPPDELEEVNLATMVEIWNGTNHQNWDVLAAERLHYGGLETQIALAEQRNTTATQLVVLTPNPDEAQTNALLNLLGLSDTAVEFDPNPKAHFAYRLILGNDYNPCFIPAKIER